MSIQLGLGVMISLLGGNEETVKAHKAAQGKIIKSAVLDDESNDDNGALLIRFTDNTNIAVFDDGQSCCESRYMTTDDDLSKFTGATFTGIELRDGPTTEDEYDQPHETQFLLVNTSLGTFTIVTHNEHNGYYGGFSIVIREW